MKRLLFISMIGLFAVSCQPAEVTCDCTGTGGTGGGSVTVSGGGLSLIDTNLIGHWKNSNPLVNMGLDQVNYQPVNDFNIYFSPDNKFYLNHSYTNGVDTIQTDWNLDYKIIEEGIMCFDNVGGWSGNNTILHYEINNGEFTYYSEDGIDYFFLCSGNLSSGWLYFPLINSEAMTYMNTHNYYVQFNSITKQ